MIPNYKLCETENTFNLQFNKTKWLGNGPACGCVYVDAFLYSVTAPMVSKHLYILPVFYTENIQFTMKIRNRVMFTNDWKHA